MTRLKRYSMPEYWPVRIKERKWVVSPMPGSHKRQMCIPLQIVVRDVLGLAETASEAKKIIKSGNIFVDKKARKEPNYSSGFMDSLELPEIKKSYRVYINKSGLFLKEIKPEDADKKVCKIIRKTSLKKGRQQITLHDGRNILLNDRKSAYKIGDSVMIQLPEQKILEHYKLQVGSGAIIVDGKNMGFEGGIKDIHEKNSMTEKSTVIVKSGENEVETLKDYIVVLNSIAAGRGREK